MKKIRENEITQTEKQVNRALKRDMKIAKQMVDFCIGNYGTQQSGIGCNFGAEARKREAYLVAMGLKEKKEVTRVVVIPEPLKKPNAETDKESETKSVDSNVPEQAETGIKKDSAAA